MKFGAGFWGRFGSHPCVLKAPPGPSSWNSWCRVRALFPVNRKCSSGTGRRGVLSTRTQRRFVRLERGKIPWDWEKAGWEQSKGSPHPPCPQCHRHPPPQSRPSHLRATRGAPAPPRSPRPLRGAQSPQSPPGTPQSSPQSVPDPLGELEGVGDGGAEQHQLHVLGQQDQHLLPHHAPLRGGTGGSGGPQNPLGTPKISCNPLELLGHHH